MQGTAGLPLPLLVLVVVLVVALLHAARGAGAAVGGGCDRRCGGMELPYPFGFSSGCTIRLGCDAGIGAAWLGGAGELGLLVRNVTPRSIILDLQPDCSRRFNTSVAALFSDSYAPSSGNSLIVSSCDDRANINSSSSGPAERFLDRNSSHCSANGSIRCIEPAPSNRGAAHHILDKSELLLSDCNGLVSSISYSDTIMGPALMLGALQLDWWVPGRCRCSVTENCTQFTAPTTGQEAFRCECPDGFEGDGFIDGTGCQSTGTASSRQQRGPFGVFAAVTAIAVVLLVLSISACFIFRRCRRRNTMTKTKQPLKAVAALFRGELVDDELHQGAAGPRRFSYDDLAAATDNFSDDRALGRGGFGSVYQGFLSDMNREVAVKRVSETSRQGWKEFVSELIGWCHGGGGELLLVYDLMHNDSLDTHLYRQDSVLMWPTRYEIVLGVGSALLYLHQDTEQRVVHRDIKPSNIMLDAYFTAKLGDFGLARLINDGRRSHTTGIAGTMGYMDPECVLAGRASVESDMYSWVVLLEVACGRRPALVQDDGDVIHLVQWVWDLYGRGKTLSAADARLKEEFDGLEMERVMVVGLWCAHPHRGMRPSIRQAMNVLRFGASLPALPARWATNYSFELRNVGHEQRQWPMICQDTAWIYPSFFAA
ncbi:unnamed protein product [Triticum turgidum subsp. durum]|uniref:Protein kinase domain-containing protein n=1 Tax=Triticum turgidum subsp. durum TaxID=4567 RepID=A0A9R0WZU2_TRITD|nr:unnamed protein product [Triticum turgidum subsp. durum]